MESAGYCSWV